MDKSKLVVVLTVVLGATAARAEAQVAEVSLGAGGAQLTAGYETWSINVHSPALEGRANVRLTGRFSIEPYVSYGRRSIAVSQYGSNVIGGDTQRTDGLYGIVLQQRLRRTTRSRFHADLSYGLNGTYFNETIPEHQFINGRTVYHTQPAQTRSDNEPMLFPSVGFGVRKSLGNHLAVRADADVVAFFVMPAGVRASVGLTLPLGPAQ
jgi:hypothetical protein